MCLFNLWDKQTCELRVGFIRCIMLSNGGDVRQLQRATTPLQNTFLCWIHACLIVLVNSCSFPFAWWLTVSWLLCSWWHCSEWVCLQWHLNLKLCNISVKYLGFATWIWIIGRHSAGIRSKRWESCAAEVFVEVLYSFWCTSFYKNFFFMCSCKGCSWTGFLLLVRFTQYTILLLTMCPSFRLLWDKI